MNMTMSRWPVALVVGLAAAGPSYQGGSAGLLAQESKVEAGEEGRAVTESLLGSRLGLALESDFFRFFNLVEVSRESNDLDQPVVLFKPSGEAFRPLATLRVTLGSEDRIRALDLQLARSFVDDPRNGIFARDIAKSFLRDAPPAEDRPAVATLADEIEFRLADSGYEMPVIGRGRELPDLPEERTPGYLVYLGRNDSYRQVLSRSTLELQRLDIGAPNDDAGGTGEKLRIALSLNE